MRFRGMKEAAFTRAASLSLAISTTLAVPTVASAQHISDVDAVKQVSRDMGDAMVARDVAKLGRIYADDAQIIAISGKLVTKADLLRNIQSGRHDLLAYELGPIDVQIIGNYAVAHGGVVEKRNWEGKDDSGQYIWMDLLEDKSTKG